MKNFFVLQVGFTFCKSEIKLINKWENKIYKKNENDTNYNSFIFCIVESPVFFFSEMKKNNFVFCLFVEEIIIKHYN